MAQWRNPVCFHHVTKGFHGGLLTLDWPCYSCVTAWRHFACPYYTTTYLKKPLDDSATVKWFPWMTNGLWILTRKWVIFLQDLRISHSLLHVQWSNWQFSLPIFATTWHVLFTIKNTHLNLALGTVNKMAMRFVLFFWWGELSRVLWWCAILRIFRVVSMFKAIKHSMNTNDRRKYRVFFFVS